MGLGWATQGFRGEEDDASYTTYLVIFQLQPGTLEKRITLGRLRGCSGDRRLVGRSCLSWSQFLMKAGKQKKEGTMKEGRNPLRTSSSSVPGTGLTFMET